MIEFIHLSILQVFGFKGKSASFLTMFFGLFGLEFLVSFLSAFGGMEIKDSKSNIH